MRDAGPNGPGRWTSTLWLVGFALLGAAIALVYLDASNQDAGNHFLRARWAWTYHWMLVDVWGRPGFTALYSVPARFGYAAARLFTVAVCTAIAWQTWRLAVDLEMSHAWLAIPLFWMLPIVLDISAQTMTEPLFALLLVIAVRLHLRGWVRAGSILASMTVLARPEGWFLIPLWGVWLLADRRVNIRRVDHWSAIALLVTGPLVWWVAAYAISYDPLFIVHNWPSNWSVHHTLISVGPLLAYNHKWREIFNPFLEPFFVIGLVALLVTRRLGLLVAAFFMIVLVHGVFMVGAGAETLAEPRYFVCVAPAIALITLSGWNLVARFATLAPRAVQLASGAALLVCSLVAAVLYVDSSVYTRDAWAIRHEWAWFDAHPVPFHRLVWSETYMCIAINCDPERRQVPQTGTEAALAAMRAAPAGTLVFWDDDTGVSFFGVHGSQIAAQGYTLLRSEAYDIPGLIARLWPGGTLPERLRWWQPPTRSMRLWMLYKGSAVAVHGHPRSPV